MNNIGIIYIKQLQKEKAEKFLLESLDLKIKLYGGGSQEVANSYNNLGVVYYKIEDYKQAKKYLHKELSSKMLSKEKEEKLAELCEVLGVLCLEKVKDP